MAEQPRSSLVLARVQKSSCSIEAQHLLPCADLQLMALRQQQHRQQRQQQQKTTTLRPIRPPHRPLPAQPQQPPPAHYPDSVFAKPAARVASSQWAVIVYSRRVPQVTVPNSSLWGISSARLMYKIIAWTILPTGAGAFGSAMVDSTSGCSDKVQNGV